MKDSEVYLKIPWWNPKVDDDPGKLSIRRYTFWGDPENFKVTPNSIVYWSNYSEILKLIL